MKKLLTQIKPSSLARFSALALATFLATGCAPTVKTVPLTIQSDPMGAYVLFQVQADRKDVRSYDWVYIGNTPLKTRRSVLKSELKDADAFIVRVMKEGYLDQEKAYTGQQMVTEAKSKGTVFWSPRLVPVN
jgi:hypothetical protein